MTTTSAPTARRVGGAFAVALIVAVTTVIGHPPGTASALAPLGATVLRPLAPCRLTDTSTVPRGARLASGSVWRTQVTGRCGVPATATAVAVTITGLDASRATFLSTFPSDVAEPGTANVTLSAGTTRSSTAIVRLSPSGSVDTFVYGGVEAAEVVLDVTAAFVPSRLGTSGRFVPIRPTRLFDTRRSRAGLVEAGSSADVSLPKGMPADATAVAITVTAEGSVDGRGSIAVGPAGDPAQLLTAVHLDEAGGTRSTTVIVAAGSRTLTLSSTVAAHLSVDLSGYFTGPSSPASVNGLFVPLAPARVFDSRESGVPVFRDGAREIGPFTLAMAGLSDVGAVVAAVTAVPHSTALGSLTAHPARTVPPDVATVELTGGRTPASGFAIVERSEPGITLAASVTTDVVVDVYGYFTGRPRVHTEPQARNDPAPDDHRIAYVGDSLTVGDLKAGLRAGLAGLGFDATVDAQNSRHVNGGADVAAGMRGRRFDPEKWVIALGTNDITRGCSAADPTVCYRASVERMLVAIGPGHDILWVNAYVGDEPELTDMFNAVLAEHEQRGDLRVIDFVTWARANPERFAEQVHLNRYEPRTELIVAAVATLYAR